MDVGKPAHPYAPVYLQLPDYVPNALPTSTILGIFAAGTTFIFAFVWLVYVSTLQHECRLTSKLLKIDRLLMCWWAFTGLTHIILEGYVAFSPEFYKDKTGFILAEIWKEYCKADSRYAVRDPSVIYAEGITALLEGPLSLLIVYAIATKKPYCYILQLVTSLGQLHGTLVYLLPALSNGYKFAASRLYYYGYFIIFNSVWIVVSTLIFISCWRKIYALFEPQSQNKTKCG